MCIFMSPTLHMMKPALTISFLLFCTSAFAQVKTINGVVISNKERISSAAIHNLQNNARATSDIRGMFSIKASKGDTLAVDYITYSPERIVVGDDENIIIMLRQSNRTLKQVNIHDSVPDPLKKFNKNKKDYAEIYFKGDKSHILEIPTTISLSTPVGIAINIDKLYNALSKQGKDARRLQRDFVRDYHDDVIDKRFTRKLVQDITGFDGKQLDDFMVSSRPEYNFMLKASDYELELYIKNKYNQTRQHALSDSQTALSTSKF